MYTEIMIVEDEILVAMDIQNRLEKLGYTVTALASSGSEAILKAGEIQPDLVLMDILLKGIGWVLYIIMNPLLTFAEVLITLSNYIIRRIQGNIRVVKAGANYSFKFLSKYNFKEKKYTGTSRLDLSTFAR